MIEDDTDRDEYDEPCIHCGQAVPTLAFPNKDPWGHIYGYFCDEDCHCSAGEAYDEQRAREFYGG